MDKNLSEIFDVTPLEITSTDITPTKIVENDVTQEFLVADEKQMELDIKRDYANSRRNFEDLIDKGKIAIDEILKVAKESEHPRAYEVAATLIKNVSDVNRELIDLQKRMQELKKLSNGGKSAPVNVDKAIFVGSTKELSQLLKGNKDA